MEKIANFEVTPGNLSGNPVTFHTFFIDLKIINYPGPGI